MNDAKQPGEAMTVDEQQVWVPVSERTAVLERFIRNQCGLQNARPHNPGPGSVELNHEEALLCADALREVEGLRADAERYRWLRNGEPVFAISSETGKFTRKVDVVALPEFDGDEIRTMGMYELDAAIDAALTTAKREEG